MRVVAVDTGGTFTDLIAVDAESETRHVVKVPSTPHAPEDAVITAIRQLPTNGHGVQRVVVGSTIGVNALLQRKGATVIFLTTAGFEDIPHIQKINRPHLYDIQWVKSQALIRRANTVGVRERIDYRGDVITPLEDDEIDRVLDRIDQLIATATMPAIAVCLLFSFANPKHEMQMKSALVERFPSVPVSISNEVAPVWREYERGSTTIADAYVKPIVGRFVRSLQNGLQENGIDTPLSIMKSNGGQTPAANAADHSAGVVLSGLAGGLLAGKYYADLLKCSNLVTLDMGGTSADVGVVNEGEITYRERYDIEFSIPIIGSFIDLTTIGAGGSSIAGFDRGGFLEVGPDSAGADPGPAAYGFGGTEATVTDANLVLGRLDPAYFLGGKMPLDSERAVAATSRIAKRLDSSVEETAIAIIRLANDNMANAVRLLTIDRGLDHRAFDLLAFGGAGPLHAAELATALDMRRVVIPVNPGLTSAFGIAAASPRVDFHLTRGLNVAGSAGTADDVAAELRERFERLVTEATAEIRSEGHSGGVQVLRTVSMRYKGQNYEQEIRVPEGEIEDGTPDELVEHFHLQHKAFYGYAMRDNVCELAQLNVSVRGKTSPPALPRLTTGSAEPASTRLVYFEDVGWAETAIYLRSSLGSGVRIQGPAVIQEPDSTTLLHPEQKLSVDDHGVMFVQRRGIAEEHK